MRLVSIQLPQSTVRQSLSVHFRSTLRSRWSLRALGYCRTLCQLFQKQSKRPSATKAKGISVVAVVVLCERRFFIAAFVNVYKFFDSVEVPAGAGASVVFYVVFFAVFLVLRVVRFGV